MALGFAPRLLVRNLFNTLKQQATASLLPLFTYFEHQWFQTISCGMWNVHGQATRTNNDCEGWHRRLNAALSSRHHPNVWTCLGLLVDEQASTDVVKQQIAAGQNVHRRNRAYEMIQRRLERLLQRYNTGAITLIEYITGVSHNIASY